jgi:hypothetical protein
VESVLLVEQTTEIEEGWVIRFCKLSNRIVRTCQREPR